MLQTEVVEEIRASILCSIIFFENRAIYEIRGKTWYIQTGRR